MIWPSGTQPIPETCSDGIKNQDEISVDFGGVCGGNSQTICFSGAVRTGYSDVWNSYARTSVDVKNSNAFITSDPASTFWVDNTNLSVRLKGFTVTADDDLNGVYPYKFFDS